jgi:RNA polymerase sigma factor (sigma-70 family)
MSAAFPLRTVHADGRGTGVQFHPARQAAVAMAASSRQASVANGSAAQGGAPELAFYRKYSETLLRRYMYRSMEIGRVPSLLGDFSFRGRSSATRARSFEDAVIFVHDVESCLKRLDRLGRELVKRIALQEYSQEETGRMMGISPRTVARRYAEALDRLTELFLTRELLEVPGCR